MLKRIGITGLIMPLRIQHQHWPLLQRCDDDAGSDTSRVLRQYFDEFSYSISCVESHAVARCTYYVLRYDRKHVRIVTFRYFSSSSVSFGENSKLKRAQAKVE